MQKQETDKQKLGNTTKLELSAMRRPDHVVAVGGTIIGAIILQKRGRIVTSVIAISRPIYAAGNSVSAMFIFPTKKFPAHSTRFGPSACFEINGVDNCKKTVFNFFAAISKALLSRVTIT